MMKKIAPLFLTTMIVILMAGCSTGAEKGSPASPTIEPTAQAGTIDTGDGTWMYAVSAGKADAILIGKGDTVCLVDAGYARSRGKILTAMEQIGAARLDAVFVTHTDDDHTEGLDWLAESGIDVGQWYASAMYLDVKEDKHPAVKAAAKRGQAVNWLKAGDTVTIGDMGFDVLAPLSMATDKDDNNSLVMMLDSLDGSILLAGDMEFPEEKALLESGAPLKCDVLKVANHADDDTTSEEFALATAPKLALISTSTEEKPETPDARSVELLKSAGAQIAVTDECSGGILIRLEKGGLSVERIDLPQPDMAVSIEKVMAEDDLVILKNDGSQTRSLAGCYLVSDRGGEYFIFPEDTSLAPDEELVIGTNSSQQKFDLLWDDKKVIHKSKHDTITLYAPNGMEISALSNQQ